MIAALLATIPQCALATTAEDLLFGDPSGADSVYEDYEDSEVITEEVDTTEGDIYGSNDTATASQYPVLQLGDEDEPDGVAYIVFVQNRLIELGYLRDGADGVYGENTETAVMAFQANHGLPETGVADVATQTKLFSDITTLVTAAPDSTMFGSATTRTQTMLAQWGFHAGSIDGKMGSGTKKSITNFQKYMLQYVPDYGATPTPAPTPEPVEGEMPIVMDIPLTTPTPASKIVTGEINDALLDYVDGNKTFTLYRQTVRSGDENDDVLRVQTRLKQLKYLYSADGQYGQLTEYALRYFQKKHGITETGVADKATQEMLFSARALESEEYVFPYKIVVDISDQRVYIGQWTGAGYTKHVKTMKCSTGLDETPTPTGTYQAGGKAGGEWYYFKEFNCYAKWGYRIVGGILFHSVVYSSQKKLRQSTVYNLGRKASHGCVRLQVKDAKWIYDHCPMGTTVIIRK